MDEHEPPDPPASDPARGDDGQGKAGWAAQPGQSSGGRSSGSTEAAPPATPPPVPPPTSEPAAWPPSSPQPSKGKRRGALAGVVLLAVVIGARFGIPLLFGEATKPGGLVNRTIVSDDFSDPSNSWPTMNNGTTSAVVSGGTYNIALHARGSELNPIQYLPQGQWGSMSVEASAQPVGSARAVFGIGCVMSTDTTSGQQMTSGTSYLFLLVPSNGKYIIVRADGGGAQPVPLKQGDLPAGAASGGGPNVLKATCSTTGETTTSLAFFADGKQIATATDPNGPGGFNGIELTAYAADANAEVRFDDAVMKRI